MTLPRVLLVEDDAAIRHWVAMALEDAGVDLVVCSSVDAALDAFQAQPVALLLTDLMLPGRSGYALLETLAQAPALQAGACLVAFSAGLDSAAQARLHALGVWRCLSKPATLAQLLDCVAEGLAHARRGSEPVDKQSGRARAEAAPAPPRGDTPPAEAADSDGARRAWAIDNHFGGNTALFDAFEASCRPALANDVHEGLAALAAQDLPALRRLAHSLQSVLRMLGLPRMADAARSVEHQALAGDMAASSAAWAVLQRHLQHWVAEGGLQSARE